MGTDHRQVAEPGGSLGRGVLHARVPRRARAALAVRLAAPAAMELDRRAAALFPVRDAAVEDGPGVDAGRREDARGNPGTRAALADRHHRPPVLQLLAV